MSQQYPNALERTMIHIKDQNAADAMRIVELKCTGQSCETCRYNTPVRFMQYCTQLDKYIKDYNICKQHQRKRDKKSPLDKA